MAQPAGDVFAARAHLWLTRFAELVTDALGQGGVFSLRASLLTAPESVPGAFNFSFGVMIHRSIKYRTPT